MSLPAIFSGISGLAGLFGGSNSAANAQAQAAANNLAARTDLLNQMRALAQGYDPHAETVNAVNYASGVAGKQLGQTLSGLDQQYQASGGDPTGDSRFRVSAQGATDRALDPLKQFAAQQAANEFQRKLSAFATAAGADPGNVASQYMQLSQSNRINQTGSLGMLSNSLNQLFGNKSSQAAPSMDTGGAAIGSSVGNTLSGLLSNLSPAQSAGQSIGSNLSSSLGL